MTERPQDRPEPPPDLVPGDRAVDAERFPGVALRLRIEHLLNHRDGVPADTWEALGPDVADILLSIAKLGGTARNESRRDVALAALAHVGDRRVAREIVDLLADGDLRRETKAYALSSLAACGGPECLPTLRDFTLAQDPLLRSRAVRGLGRLGTPDDLDRLVAIVGDDPTPQIRLDAYRSVRSTEERSGRAPMTLDEPDVDYPRRTEIRRMPTRPRR
ncbi:MAG: HEAT repeat domain-containing protein [Actinomycetia bacterium]|nr:HEAT repeat domain-containing protein [Actinomycetes bacterium]